MSRDAHPTYLHLHAPHHADLFEEFCRPPSSYPSSSTTAATNAASSSSHHHYHHHHHHHNNSLTHPTTLTNPPHASHSNPPPSSPSLPISLPGHFLPYDPIPLPHHLQPLNPEDEDGLVPDQHAAFGILRALGGPSAGTSAAGHRGGASAAMNGTEGGRHYRDGAGVAMIGGGGGGASAAAMGMGEDSRAGNTNAEPAWRDFGLEVVLDGVDGVVRNAEGEVVGRGGGGGGEVFGAGLRAGGAGYSAGVWNGMRGVGSRAVNGGRVGLGREGFARRRPMSGLR